MPLIRPSKSSAADIQLLVFDVDGTLTDGGLYFGASGEAYKRFNARDGLGLVITKQYGLRTAFLSGRTSEATTARARELLIDSCVQGSRHKVRDLAALAVGFGLSLEQTAMMGDDENDIESLRAAGISAAPADAHGSVLAEANYIATKAGGHGAARDFIDWIVQHRQPIR